METSEHILKLARVGFGYDINDADRKALREAAAALTAAEARIKVLDHECQSSMATIAAERARADKAEAALLSARSAEPVADAYYEAWKENFERKVRFAYAHPTPEASDV